MNKIEVKITPDDYYHSQWVHQKLSVSKFFIITLLTVWLAYFLYSALNVELSIAVGSASGWLLWYFGYYLVYLRYKCNKIYRQQKSLNLPAQFEWDREGISAINERGVVKIKWSDYVKWRESKRIIMLYQSDLIFNIIPKSSFENTDQENDFLSNLQSISS
ncbi:YcxB family protein [Microbulbifer sp. PSTR4-B]|uniref:YcxB family protein n=1 Tax=Microbulbifer sp. PSTR4-B TaxID=3243396 RepID=UPI004039084F